MASAESKYCREKDKTGARQKQAVPPGGQREKMDIKTEDRRSIDCGSTLSSKDLFLYVLLNITYQNAF